MATDSYGIFGFILSSTRALVKIKIPTGEDTADFGLAIGKGAMHGTRERIVASDDM